MGNYPPNNHPPVNGLDLTAGICFPFKGFVGVSSGIWGLGADYKGEELQDSRVYVQSSILCSYGAGAARL